MKKRYEGSCHCGKVRFDAEIDLAEGTGKCNCSICTKGRAWGVMIPTASFRLQTGEADLSDYQFGARTVHHPFCRHCGVRPFGRGRIEGMGDFVFVNVACLDGVDPRELAEAPVRFANGRENDWAHPPAETRHL